MKYGCYNRPPLKTVAVVQDGWIVQPGTRAPRMIAINDPMSKNCRYENASTDRGCAGCIHGQHQETTA